MNKKGLFIAVLLVFVFSLMFGCSVGFCQENVTITTYYPAPFGVYVSLRTINNNAQVDLNTDFTGNANIEIKSTNVGPNRLAYIDFANNPATDFDWRFIELTGRDFNIRSSVADRNAQVRITNAANQGITLVAGELIVCP